jgi:outer membrane murein-binding lipoprotein Lpp
MLITTTMETVMNKFAMILLAAVVSGTAAHAGSISFDGRADMISNDYDDKSSSADNVQFKLDTVRLDAKGKLNDSVSYRLRPRFTKNRTVSNRDGVGTDLDLAFITNKFNDSLSLTVGKFATDMGGIEGNTAGADLYLKTIANGTGHGIGDQYYTGAKLAYLIGDHEVALHIANQFVDASGFGNDGTASKFNQNKFTTGLVFKGSLMEKHLTVVASYHTQDGAVRTTGTAVVPPGTEDTKYKNTYMALGAKYDTDMFVVEGDYLMHTLGGYTVAYSATQAAKDDMLATMQLGFAYKMDQWTPKIKLESTTDTYASATTDTKVAYTGIQLAVEYKPVKEDNFRYHLAYLQREGKADTAGALAQTDKNIILGTRIMADFLK